MSRLLSCKEASSEPGLIVGLFLNILTDCEFPLSLSDLSTYSFSIEGNIMDQYCIDDTFLLDSGLPTLEKAFEHTIHWCVPSWPLSRISSKDGLITGGEFLFLTLFKQSGGCFSVSQWQVQYPSRSSISRWTLFGGVHGR